MNFQTLSWAQVLLLSISFTLSLPGSHGRSTSDTLNLDSADHSLPTTNTKSEVVQLSQLLRNYNNISTLAFNVLERVANHSWEWGTQSEVILERQYPCLSVYSHANPLPFERNDWDRSPAKEIINLVDPIIETRPVGKLPIVDGDGAAADPASLGIAVMIASLTTPKKKNSKEYLKLINDQYSFLMNDVPRSKSGAISHREAEVQFWGDFVYMVPPFLAFYGAQNSDLSQIELAYTQIKLYRERLYTPSGKVKLWQHVLPDVGKNATILDYRYWSTSNGWAAAGMMRVYATLLNLQDKDMRAKTQAWRDDLAEWTAEILRAAFSYQDKETGLLPNAFGVKKTFLECSGTAVLASAAFRLLSFEPQRRSSLPMNAILKSVTALFTKFTNPRTGAVAPVVNPMDWGSEVPFNGTKPINGYVSPEGQAFVVLLHEAIRSYLQRIDESNASQYASDFVLFKNCQ